MNILFISSGNSKTGISPIILSQANSLINEGHFVDHFTIKGKGILGYLKNRTKLRHILKSKSYDIIHAHYSKSAFLASLSTSNKIVVSLMGSDVLEKWYFKYVNYFFYILSWKHVIVKSKEMALSSIGIPVSIVPNGVNFNIFKPIEKEEALSRVGWDKNKIHILFCSNQNRPEKNYNLASDAYNLINDNRVVLHCLDNINHSEIPYYLNASNLVLMTSLWEGSPNIIKESMACNTPIVSTDVGDVKNIISNTEGCYIAKFNKQDVYNCINKAILFNSKTKGRDNITHLKDSVIANQIINIYNKVVIN